MSRTATRKVLYLAILVGVAGIALVLLNAFHYSLVAVLAVALVLLVPGRIQGHYWRQFFQARDLVAQRRYREAEPLFDQFLALVRREPWLKRLIWMNYGVYTRDVEAMTLNNLGVCALEEGRFEAAETHLNKATALDLQNPLPYYNLAIVQQALGRVEAAQRDWSRSQELGYRRTPFDMVIHRAGELLARVEGRTLARSHGAA
jgi:tetratricopeptide (TPR) repeat protein